MTSPIGKLGPRYDKYDPISGGFRARVAEAWNDTGVQATTHVGKIFGVSLNSSGRVVRGGADASAIVGVVIVQEAKSIGDVVDVMTAGEIADVFTLNDGTTATVPGVVWVNPAAPGNIGQGTLDTNKAIGRLLEKDGRDRLVVRVNW